VYAIILVYIVIVGGQNVTCTICIEEMVQMQVVTELPCLHTFHLDCGWLAQVSAAVSIER